MSSLVAEFIINPVARTVRRFSSPFATASDTEPVRRLPRDFTLDNGDAVADADYDASYASLPGLLFLRSPDVALGARSPPLLVPQRRYPPPPVDGDTSRDSTPRSGSSVLFEMDRPGTAEPEDASTVSSDLPQSSDGVDSAVAAGISAEKSRALPANDGMSDMRRRIQIIQSSSITVDQKRYLMQQVLTENYTKARGAKAISKDSDSPPRPKSEILPAPSSYISRDLGFGISALETLKSWTGLEEEQAPINFTQDDAQPTYRPLSHAHLSDAFIDHTEQALDTVEEFVPELGCVHYKRNVRVQCAECDKWYTCRLCHDEIEEHILPRRLTKNMLCMLCGHAQKASDTCIHCGESAASYYCTICKLWSDDVNKHIYHCDDCGICRVGRGLEKDFFHCKTCCACISIATKDDHKCIERATEANCPICNDIMFSSPQKVIFMDCGHPIHQNCFNEYMNTSYKCPLCSKSIVKMDALFLNLANIIKEQPMPEEYCNVRSILFCNDCSAKSSTDYHFLGLRCQICQSFNTVELDRSPMPADASGSQEGAASTGPTHSRTVSAGATGTSWTRADDSSSSPLHSPGLRSNDRFSLGPASPTRNVQFVEPEPILDEGDQEEEFDSWGRKITAEDSGDDDGSEEEEDDDIDSELDEEYDDEEEDDEVDNEHHLEINLLGHR